MLLLDGSTTKAKGKPTRKVPHSFQVLNAVQGQEFCFEEFMLKDIEHVTTKGGGGMTGGAATMNGMNNPGGMMMGGK